MKAVMMENRDARQQGKRSIILTRDSLHGNSEAGPLLPLHHHLLLLCISQA